jgi:hypothetical protein
VLLLLLSTPMQRQTRHLLLAVVTAATGMLHE